MVRLQSKQHRSRILVLHVFLSPTDCPGWLNRIVWAESPEALAEREEVGRHVGQSVLLQFQRIVHLLGGALWGGSEMWSLAGFQWQLKRIGSFPRNESRSSKQRTSPNQESLGRKQGATYILRVLLQSPLMRAGNCSTHSPLLLLCRAAVSLMNHVPVTREDPCELREVDMDEQQEHTIPQKTHLVKAHVRVAGCPGLS